MNLNSKSFFVIFGLITISLMIVAPSTSSLQISGQESEKSFKGQDRPLKPLKELNELPPPEAVSVLELPEEFFQSEDEKDISKLPPLTESEIMELPLENDTIFGVTEVVKKLPEVLITTSEVKENQTAVETETNETESQGIDDLLFPGDFASPILQNLDLKKHDQVMQTYENETSVETDTFTTEHVTLVEDQDEQIEETDSENVVQRLNVTILGLFLNKTMSVIETE